MNKIIKKILIILFIMLIINPFYHPYSPIFSYKKETLAASLRMEKSVRTKYIHFPSSDDPDMWVQDSAGQWVNLTTQWKQLIQSGAIKMSVQEGSTKRPMEVGLQLNEATGAIEYYGRYTDGHREQRSEKVQVAEFGKYRVTYNPFRGFRMSPEELEKLRNTKTSSRPNPLKPHHPMTACPFGCGSTEKGKNYLHERTPVHSPVLHGRKWDIFYNASPVEQEGHFLLIPDYKDPRNQREQRITQEDLEDVLLLAEHTKNVVITYNSPNAGASVNHPHWQLFKFKNGNHTVATRNPVGIGNKKKRDKQKQVLLDEEALMKKHAQELEWYALGTAQQEYVCLHPYTREIHFGSSNREKSSQRLFVRDNVEIYQVSNYAATGVVFRGTDTVSIAAVMFELIHYLQEKGIPFNVVKIGKFADQVYVFIRNIDAIITEEFPGMAVAAYELTGNFTVIIPEAFQNASSALVQKALARTTLEEKKVKAIMWQVYYIEMMLEEFANRPPRERKEEQLPPPRIFPRLTVDQGVVHLVERAV